ncbi:unnamed protein product [Protopolystoma xenopodis]|uniref:Uncharacterized protein n=1 Tax=Protopolystoma xenopodis TaxID=117903 RepID=A0A3S5BBR0_9PLAT|nr:unnamed protein product [Protopolystoma xenopodis]
MGGNESMVTEMEMDVIPCRAEAMVTTKSSAKRSDRRSDEETADSAEDSENVAVCPMKDDRLSGRKRSSSADACKVYRDVK